MTAEQRDDTAAAVGFAAALALAAGGVGIVVAALAVGVERAWSSWRGTRGPGGGWSRHLEDQRAWLDADRARLDDWRSRRRAWWKAGADPDTEPARPALSSGAGAAGRRAAAKVAVGVARVGSATAAFVEGVRDGWREARRVRAEGGTFKDIAGAQPSRPAAPISTGDPTPKRDTEDAPQPGRTHEPVKATPAEKSQPEPDRNTGGTPMTSTQGETNLDYTAADLAGIQTELAAIEEHNDALAARRTALQAKIASASERVESTGGTTATAQALDAARAVADRLGQHLAGVSDSTVEAFDVTQAAHAGLAPARDAQDALQASGARGEFVDAATSG